jgi:hypothetical protein
MSLNRRFDPEGEACGAVELSERIGPKQAAQHYFDRLLLEESLGVFDALVLLTDAAENDRNHDGFTAGEYELVRLELENLISEAGGFDS